jgi:hypothetical protein
VNVTAADIANDLDIVDTPNGSGSDTVTVQQINPDTGAVVATSTGVVVLARVIDKREQPIGDGSIPAETRRFHLKSANVSFVPKTRDRVVDGSDTWKIDSVQRAAFGTRYVVETVKVQ